MYDALYARQSVEKVDSISVESQLELCRHETHGRLYKEYIDKGYSGKNTNRPAFEEMMEDIKQGKIQRVIVYKLDRISRSILDFANMMEVFHEYNVEFVSSTEKFDTSTPLGRAMLNICIVFAQLERETIQKRVTDAYYSRCKRGFYMGGRIPYGFKKQETVIDGIKTSKYVPVPEEAEQIRLIYSLYADSNNSLGDIIDYFNKNGIKHLRGGVWVASRLSEILRNPIYVKADVNVYDFFQAQGAKVFNPVSDFTGYYACYLYKAESTTRSKSELLGKEVVLAPHEGIVSSRDWIKCRKRCLSNRQLAKTCKAKNSWLLGKVKCGKCGYGLIVVKANTKWKRYFICAGASSTKKAKCQGLGSTVYADLLEDYVSKAIREHLAEFQTLRKQEKQRIDPKINKLKIRIAEINKEINDVIDRMIGIDSLPMDYINNKIMELDSEKRKLQVELDDLESSLYNTPIDTIANHVEAWNEITFEDKQAVVDILIKVIIVADGKVEITWND